MLNKNKQNMQKNKILQIKKIDVSSINNTNHLGSYNPFNSSTKTWFNSAYFFNKNSIRSVSFLDILVSNIINIYFNITNFNLKKNFKKENFHKKYLSANKIIAGKPRIKHTNDKIIINLYTFNRNKQFFRKKLFKLYKNFIKFNITILKNNRKFNSIVYKLKNNKQLNFYRNILLVKFFTSHKVSSTIVSIKKNFKSNSINILNLYLRERKIKELIENYNYKFLKNTLKRKILIFKYKQNSIFNDYKFNYILLYKLGIIISTLYNKKIEFNIINLKYPYLDSNIFTNIIAKKLQNREINNRKLFSRALKWIVMYKKYRLIPKFRYIRNTILNNNLKNLNVSVPDNILNKDYLNLLLNRLFNNKLRLEKENKKNTIIYKKFYRLLRYRKIAGIKLKSKGRLTYKLTASRSITKEQSRGYLIDLEHASWLKSFYRGNRKPNINYTNINSVTRNGSFGLKGWISSR